MIKNAHITLKPPTSHLLRKSCIQLSHGIAVEPSYFHSHYFPKGNFSHFLYLTSCSNHPKAYLKMEQGMFGTVMLKIFVHSFSFQKKILST